MNSGHHRSLSLGLGTVLTALLVTVTPTLAGVGGGFILTYPSTVTVGESNVPVSMTFVNSSTAPNDTENVLLLDFHHTPSCAAGLFSTCQPADRILTCSPSLGRRRVRSERPVPASPSRLPLT